MTKTDSDLFEVRRDDGELCGFIAVEPQQTWALTVFMVPVTSFPSRDAAVDFVVNHGLELLQANWFGFIDDEWQLVRIQEARPDRVVVTTDIYGVGDGFSHSFIGATEDLRLADPITRLW